MNDLNACLLINVNRFSEIMYNILLKRELSCLNARVKRNIVMHENKIQAKSKIA